MPQLQEATAVAATVPPQLNSITFGLDTNEFAASYMVLEVANVNVNDVVNVRRGPDMTWTGKLKQQLGGNFWLAVLRYTGTPILTITVVDAETLTVTVTSGTQTSNDAQVVTNVYNTGP